MAKKRGLSPYHIELSESLHPVFYIKYQFLRVFLFGMHSNLFSNPFKTIIWWGCASVSVKSGGCKFGDDKTRGCPLSKKGGCSFAVGTQTQTQRGLSGGGGGGGGYCL